MTWHGISRIRSGLAGSGTTRTRFDVIARRINSRASGSFECVSRIERSDDELRDSEAGESASRTPGVARFGFMDGRLTRMDDIALTSRKTLVLIISTIPKGNQGGHTALL